MMEWNTEQYARLFKAMSAMFWRHPLWQANWFDGLSSWSRYLEELGINNSSLKPSASWGELCDSIKIEFLYNQRLVPTNDVLYYRRIPTVWPSDSMTSLTVVLAAHDQENVFITDPSINTDYSEFENWSVKAIPWDPQNFKSLLDDYRTPGTDPSRPKGGELLTIPKDTAEKILVLGLPEQPELE